MPIATIVEVAFASEPLDAVPVWTDITRWVRLDDQIRISRGAADELTEIPAGLLTLTLDNSDGRFTPGNAAGPYYPNVVKSRRIRVRQVHVHANHLAKGGFEDASSAEWTAFGSTPPAKTSSTARAHEGIRSMRITWATGTTANGVQATAEGLQAGVVYTASAWVWVTVGVPAIRLGISGIGTGSPSTTTGTWQQITYTFTATDTDELVQFTPDSATTSGQQVWVDEIMLAAGTTAAVFEENAPLTSTRYNGYVNRWPVTWPGGNRVAHTAITATDLFKPLARHPVRSLLEEEVLLDGPLAYYPLSEAAGSTSAGDLSGTVSGSLAIVQAGSGGDLTFAALTGPAADGLSAPEFTPGSATSGLYLTVDVGPAFEATSTSDYIFAEAWFSTTTTGRTMFTISSNIFSYGLNFKLESGTGKFQIIFTYRDGAPTTSTVTWPTANLADGNVHHVYYNEFTSTVYIDGVSQGTQTRPVVTQLRRLSVGGNFGADLWVGGVSHVAFGPKHASPATRAADRYAAGALGLAGETADDRVTRIAGYAGIAVTTEGTLFDPIASQGPGGKSALALLQEVAGSESGRLFAARDEGLVYQARDLRYDSTSSLSLAAADCEPPAYADDDQYLVNQVEASRPGGATVRVADLDSQAKFFVYSKTLSLLKTTDAGVVDAAQWAVNRYSDPQSRVQSLQVEGATLGTTTYRALLALDISGVFTLTGLPSQAPTSTELLVVEGYTEVIEPEHHTWTFLTSPAVVDQVWQLDSATHSQLNTTTRLAY